MIHIERITTSSDNRLPLLMALYEEAFPVEERRAAEQLFHLIDTERSMHFNLVTSEGETAGLFIYWDMEEFFYLEHLAVDAALRNREIGRQILDYAARELQGLRLLEVEPDETEMAARRIGYYRRNGYEILDRDYIQPSYGSHEDACALWIMGSEPSPELEKQIEQIKERVYRQNVGKPEKK